MIKKLKYMYKGYKIKKLYKKMNIKLSSEEDFLDYLVNKDIRNKIIEVITID